MIIFATESININLITFLSFLSFSSYFSLARLFCVEFEWTFLPGLFPTKCPWNVEITWALFHGDYASSDNIW